MSEGDTSVPGDGDDRRQSPPPPDRQPEQEPVPAEVWSQAAHHGSQVPNPPTDPFAPPAVEPWSPSPPGPAGSVGQPGSPPPPPPETPTFTDLEPEAWGQPPRQGVRTDERRGGPGRAWIVGGLVAVLIAGLVGGVVGAQLESGSGSSSSTSTPSFGSNTSTLPKLGDVQSILARVEPAVVNINTQGGGGRSLGSGAATGMIIRSDGQVLTNSHVVQGARSVSVTIPGQSGSHQATVTSADPSADVALIQIQGVSGLPTVTLGDSGAVQVGDSVIAIGNALNLGRQPTVTEGIISATNRSLNSGSQSLSGLLQTDAAISPGNSGGPLVNSSAQVIGINTAALTGSGQEPAQNVGFAIPISDAKSKIAQLKPGQGVSGGGSTAPNGGFLGVSVLDASETPGGGPGAVVAQVVPGSPANQIGLQTGDVIVSVDNKPVASPNDLASAVSSHHPGDHVQISWTRNGAPQSATATLTGQPAAGQGG